MYNNKWDIFASSGKISDYLDYKGYVCCTDNINGEANETETINNADAQRIGYKGISCG